MQIVTKGHSALSERALKVPHGTDESVLIDIMWEALGKTSGIGLAANQVGILSRVIIINLNEFVGTIINPTITKCSDNLKLSKEGCISFPGQIVNVKRESVVVVEGFDRHWNPIKKKFRGLGACCVQHEIDHLNGVTIEDK
jgi:peptide deformylase